MPEDDFDDIVTVKLKGTFAVSRWAASYWRERYEAGDRADRAIVNTSASGLDSPFPLNTNYAAANAGVGAMTIVHSLELSRYGVWVNCISPGARSRLLSNLPGGLTSLTQDIPEAGEYDPWHPVHQATVVAQLATADCPLSGQVLTVRGSTVTLSRNWSLGEQIAKDDAGWNVEELGRALTELPVEDPFGELIPIVANYGVTGREQVQQLLNTILDNYERDEKASQP